MRDKLYLAVILLMWSWFQLFGEARSFTEPLPPPIYQDNFLSISASAVRLLPESDAKTIVLQTPRESWAGDVKATIRYLTPESGNVGSAGQLSLISYREKYEETYVYVNFSLSKLYGDDKLIIDFEAKVKMDILSYSNYNDLVNGIKLITGDRKFTYLVDVLGRKALSMSHIPNPDQN